MSADWLQFGAPTLDHPFGLHLWPIFEKAFDTLVGYKPQEFRYVIGETPLSTLQGTTLTLIAYYIIVFGGRELMKNQKPFKFNTAFKIHNFYLTCISGGLLVLFLEQLIPTLYRHGVFYTICQHKGGWTNELVILYYLNYLTKYLELLDTMFLVVRKKPLTFLHTYHHGATAFLCYTQLLGHTAVSWVPITLNLSVHVVMYWYYFQAARGIKIWWKKYITVGQIIQFVLDLGFVYFATYTFYVNLYFPWLPNAGTCAGREPAAMAGCLVLSSYLFLFISFYIATYKTPEKKQKVERRGSRTVEALVEMKDEQVPTFAETKRRFSGEGSPMYRIRNSFSSSSPISPRFPGSPRFGVASIDGVATGSGNNMSNRQNAKAAQRRPSQWPGQDK